MRSILVRVNPDKALLGAFVGPSGRFCNQLQNLGSTFIMGNAGIIVQKKEAAHAFETASLRQSRSVLPIQLLL
jgi:hypothetical protein